MHRIHVPGMGGNGRRRRPDAAGTAPDAGPGTRTALLTAERPGLVTADRTGRPLHGFTEVADLSTDLVRALLRVDVCLLLRIADGRLAMLADSPRLAEPVCGPLHGPEATPVLEGMIAEGIAVEGLRELDPQGDDALLARAVAQVADDLGCEGSAGAGLYDHDGRLTGVLAVFSEHPFTGDPTAFARVLRHHADELGPLLEQEMADVAAGRTEDPAIG